VRSGRLYTKVSVLKARHDGLDRYGDRESGEGGGGDSREDTDVLIVRVQQEPLASDGQD
jgi:hypothetical protein